MRYRVQELADGRIRVRVYPHHQVEMGGIGDDVFAAAERAFAAADSVSRGPLGAILPPGTRQGIAVVRGLVSSARKGKLKEALAAVPDKARKAASSVIEHLTEWF